MSRVPVAMWMVMHEGHEHSGESAASPLLAIVGILAILVFVSVAWYAYTRVL